MVLKNYFFLVLIIFSSLFAESQTFRRIETLSRITNLTNNHGIAAADIDGDHDIDLFIVSRLKDEGKSSENYSKLFLNNNDGTYTDITSSAGLAGLHPYEDNHTNDPNFPQNFSYDGYKFGASWGDFDNDGDPDLFLTNAHRVQLFRNNGNNTFTNITDASGITNINGLLNSSSAWVDYDNDGYLDIFISDYGSTGGGNKLYRNLGNGTFTDVTNIVLPNVSNAFTYMMFPFDFNNDGLLDFYTSNDYTDDNRLYISNTNGQPYTESSNQYNVQTANNSMGLDFGDFDEDGEYEIFATTINNNSFFDKNNSSYQNIASTVGLVNTDWSWDTKFWDFDNNGFLDIFVANGYVTRNNRNKLYVNQRVTGENNFVDRASDYKIDFEGYSCSSVPFDFDNDGDLDLFVTNVRLEPAFYENKTIDLNQGSDQNWVKIHLKGVESNKNGLGAKLVLTTNNKTLYRYNYSVGLYSQNLLPIHFGLNNSSTITSLVINWPSGQVQSFENLDVNKDFEVVEGTGITELNITPSIKSRGCTDPRACNFDSLAFVNDGSCTYLAPGQINGPSSSYYLDTETYSYATTNNSTFNWSISGGEILSGQGTNSITVRWHIANEGQVTLVESGVCDTEPIVYNVSLGYDKNDNNFSIARLWNEILLHAIRNDFARPTVHARNLFHTSIAFYDVWSIHNEGSNTYLIGNTIHGFTSSFNGFTPNDDKDESINKALSFAAYRLLKHRFSDSPGYQSTLARMNLYMDELEYDKDYTNTDYSTGDSAALGNFIAETIINYGLQDGSNESLSYNNSYYQPVNTPLITEFSGIDLSIDPNRWQPLSFSSFIDQSGNLIGTNTPDFLSPEWGNVNPFSLTDSDKVTYVRNSNSYNVYKDPLSPPYLEDNDPFSSSSSSYKWGFSLVSYWSSHLDPNDGVMWDISPKSIGNIDIQQMPTNFSAYDSFYKELLGGDIGQGRSLNPITNMPYQEQLVPRGDYTRVLAEFWADGPDSETPPGHWFTILNYVNEHPDLVKKIGGSGEIIDDLEWDIKSYFTLGGAMHDAAISAWSIKGWYDYIRPISAIRYMVSLGQSSDPNLPSYNEKGIELLDGYVELIDQGDPLQGVNGVNIGKIKLKAWRGHADIVNPEVDQSGVGWILGESWMPYQRPSFVTPPFAGYVSGHSTYSRAAAEILTMFTGDEYFPGGMGEFIAKKNEFLVFEEGPSVDVILQWATYRDASDQCSLSRIWGGIHPPADDIPGRLIGEEIGNKAFNKALEYFNGTSLKNEDNVLNKVSIHPNPIHSGSYITIKTTVSIDDVKLFDVKGSEIKIDLIQNQSNTKELRFQVPKNLGIGVYFLKINNSSKKIVVH